MKIFKELELLGFFEWLAEMHNLRDTDMKPEYLDELPLNDIHLTVCNSMAFRWFREKYDLFCWVEKFHKDETYIFQIPPANFTKIQGHFETYEEAELACLEKLIEIVEENELNKQSN